MSSCSGVTMCLAEGATLCNVLAESCPPCLYVLTGGEYSCYSRNPTQKCPYPSTYAECDKLNSTPLNTTLSNTDNPNDEARSITPSNPSTTAEISTNPLVNTTTPSFESPRIPTNSNPIDPTSRTSNNSPTTATTKASASDSFTAINAILVIGAAFLVLVVVIFVFRRTKKNSTKLAASRDGTVASGHNNSAWSDRTLDSNESGGDNLYSTYNYRAEDKSQDISILADSQGSTASGDLDHSASSLRPTADFSNYGGTSHYLTSSQYYVDYSVSTGPDLDIPTATFIQNPTNRSNQSTMSLTKTNNHFVDVTGSSTSMRGSELDPVLPLTVSQLLPQAIDEGQEEGYKAPYRHGTKQAFKTTRQQASSARKPHLLGVSMASSTYDIVDPMTMLDVETRSTEMHVEDSQYPKFSFESSTSSADIYDGDWSEVESNGGSRVQFDAVEHMI